VLSIQVRVEHQGTAWHWPSNSSHSSKAPSTGNDAVGWMLESIKTLFHTPTAAQPCQCKYQSTAVTLKRSESARSRCCSFRLQTWSVTTKRYSTSTAVTIPHRWRDIVIQGSKRAFKHSPHSSAPTQERCYVPNSESSKGRLRLHIAQPAPVKVQLLDSASSLQQL